MFKPSMSVSRTALLIGIIAVGALALAGCAPTSAATTTTHHKAAAAPAPAYTPPPAPVLSGIIDIDGLSGYSATTVQVNEVNPTTGASKQWSNFLSGSTDAGPITLNTNAILDYGPTPIAAASLFSADFKDMAAQQTDSSQHTNLGWETSNHTFTNVTAPLWKAGTFASVPTFRNPQFAADGNYYFTSDIDVCVDCTRGTFMSTSVANPGTPTAVPNETGDNDWYWMSPNGVVSAQNPGNYFYQENITKGVGTVRADSWVDAGRWLGTDSEESQVWLSDTLTAPANINPLDWGTSGLALTPDVSGYKVWSPVVSPDLKTVAFLAQQGVTISIFTVPITGGTPTQLKTTGLTLSSSSVLAGWK